VTFFGWGLAVRALSFLQWFDVVKLVCYQEGYPASINMRQLSPNFSVLLRRKRRTKIQQEQIQMEMTVNKVWVYVSTEWLIELMFLRPNRHKRDHFGDVLPSQHLRKLNLKPGLTIGWTTGCMVYTNIQPSNHPTSCQTGCTTGLTTGCIVQTGFTTTKANNIGTNQHLTLLMQEQKL